MADDPWGQFVEKPAAQDPWAQFAAPQQGAPTPPPGVQQGTPGGQPDLASRAIWQKPADMGWQDFLLGHLAAVGSKSVAGAPQAADDYARAISDVATYGQADRLAAYMGGTDLAAERAKTAAAHQRLGLMDYPASMIGYAPTGELGIASKVGGAVAPAVGRWAGGVLGSAAEGAGAGAAGALGHGESVGTGALVGGALGAAGGVPGGVAGRGATLPAAVPEATLRSQATAAYAPLGEHVFHGPTQVGPALDAVTNTMSGAEQDIAKSTVARANKLGDQSLVTGSDIQKYQKIFGGLAKTGNDVDREFAPQFKSALEDIMQNVTPYGRNLTPGQGMSLMMPGTLGGTGLQAGGAATARDLGDILHGRAQDVERLGQWQDKANVAGGPDVGSQARSYLLQDKNFAPPGTTIYDALNTLAATAKPVQTSAAPSAWDVRHLAGPLIGAGAGGVFGLSTSAQDPSRIGEEMLTGLGIGYGAHKLFPAVQGMIQRAAQQRALDAARVVASTGRAQAPVLPAAPFREAVRRLIYGEGAAGAY